MSASADELRALCAAERYDEATERVIQWYGAEILGLLVALAPDETTAGDAYSQFCEQMWKSLPKFRFESSVRTWAYVIARRALIAVHRARGRGPRLEAVAPSQLPERVASARSTTRPYLKTTHKDALRAVRSTLSEEDQLLLVLRLDRELSWPAIARVMADRSDCDEATLQRNAATLRKRYQRAKKRLAAELAAAGYHTES